MSKQLSFEVSLRVSDDVAEGRAAEVLEAMLNDLTQAEQYHEVMVVDDVTSRDSASAEILDMLDGLDRTTVDAAIDAVETMGDEDE